MNRMLPLMVLTLLLACSPAKHPDFAGLSRVCGSVEYADAKAVVLLTTPDQEPLAAADIEALHAQFRDEKGTLTPLTPSARGCLSLPMAPGLLEIQSPRAAWGLAKAIDPGTLERLTRLALQKGGAYTFKLACPAEGLFTSPQMNLPILGQIEGPAELFELQLILRDQAEANHLVFRKSLGVPFSKLPDHLDLQSLKEGTYTLDVRLRDLTRNWNDADPSQVQSCPVQLIRSVPSLSGPNLVSHLGFEIFKKGDTLPVTLSDARSRLYVCREKAVLSEDCESASLCQNPDQFTLVQTISLNEPGSWHYFVQAENIVKVRSKPSCRKIFVSASAPLVKARWKDPIPDEENAVLQQPQSSLQLQITVQHPVVPTAQLEDSLQCRAEFLIGGLLIRKGADVTCLSGRCQGLPLNDWQPCDASLQLSIASALQLPNLLNSQLRVFMRASDGAGQTQEISKSVWLQKSRWVMSDVSQGDAYESALAPDGTLVFVNSAFQTLQVKEGGPTVLDPPDASAQGVTLVQLSDGGLLSAWRVNGHTVFAEYSEGRWQTRLFPGWDPEYAPCARLFPEADGSFVCSAQGSLTHLSRTGVLQRVEAAPSCLGLFSDTIARLGEKDWVVSCRRSLYRFDAAKNSWIDLGSLKRLFENPDIFSIPQIAEGALERDGQGRVWLLATSGFEGALATAYVDDQGLHAVPAPLPFQTDFPSLTLACNRLGQMQFMDRVWDDATRSWQTLPEIQSLFPVKAELRVKRLSSGALLYESEHLVVYETSDGTRSLYPWKGLDLPGRSAIENVHRNAAGETYLHAAFRNRRSIYQFSTRHWAFFGQSFLNLADAPILPYQTSDAVRVQSVSQGTFALQEGAWQSVCEELKASYSTPFATSRGLFLGGFEGLYACDPKTRTWQTVLGFTEDAFEDFNDWLVPTAANLVEDASGRIWFGKRSGRLVFLEGDQYHIFPWPEANGAIDALLMIKGRVATLGYNKLTVWNEGKQAFDVTDFADLGIDAAFDGTVKATAQGLLIYASDADHFRVLDRNEERERSERFMEGCGQFLSRKDGSLICFTWEGVYHQFPGAAWTRLVALENLDKAHAILEGDRYLWVPVGADIIRIDLPTAR